MNYLVGGILCVLGCFGTLLFGGVLCVGLFFTYLGIRDGATFSENYADAFVTYGVAFLSSLAMIWLGRMFQR